MPYTDENHVLTEFGDGVTADSGSIRQARESIYALANAVAAWTQAAAALNTAFDQVQYNLVEYLGHGNSSEITADEKEAITEILQIDNNGQRVETDWMDSTMALDIFNTSDYVLRLLGLSYGEFFTIADLLKELQESDTHTAYASLSTETQNALQALRYRIPAWSNHAGRSLLELMSVRATKL